MNFDIIELWQTSVHATDPNTGHCESNSQTAERKECEDTTGVLQSPHGACTGSPGGTSQTLRPAGAGYYIFTGVRMSFVN